MFVIVTFMFYCILEYLYTFLRLDLDCAARVCLQSFLKNVESFLHFFDLKNVCDSSVVLTHSWSLVERSGWGNHGSLVVHAELLKHPFCEVLCVVNGEFGDCVECTHRAWSEYAFDLVETLDHEVSALDVFCLNLVEVLVWCVKCTD